MARWQRFRQWINRDDGRAFQVGNRNLDAKQIAGYLLMTAALFCFVAHQSVGDSRWAWAAWVLLLSGAVLAIWDEQGESK